MLNLTAANTIAYSSNGNAHQMAEPPIGKGAYGIVHRIVGNQDVAAKLYLPNVLAQPLAQRKRHANKIRQMCKLGTPETGQNTYVAWPIDTLSMSSATTEYNDKPIHGYLMPKAPDGTLSIDKLIQQPTTSRKSRITAELLQQATNNLHRHGIVIGDVNGANFALAPDDTLWMFDADSWQFTDQNGTLHYAEGATTGYTHPDVIQRVLGILPNCLDQQCPLSGQVHAPTPGCQPRNPDHDQYAVNRLTAQLLDSRATSRTPFTAR